MSKLIHKINRCLLFVYPIFFALPDLKVRVLYINLRFDDVIIYFLFCLNCMAILKFKKYYRPLLFYGSHFLLILIATISLILTILLGKYQIDWYQIMRTYGSLPLLLILPILLQDSKTRTYFYKGVMLAIPAVIVSGIYNFYTTDIISSGLDYKISAEYKERFNSESLNPNSIGLFGLLFGYVLMHYYMETKRKAVLILSLLGFMIPFLILTRGHALCAAVALCVYALLLKNGWRFKIAIGAGLLGFALTILILSLVNPVINSALVKTGLTSREILWMQGLELIKWSKGLGYGFGTEGMLYIKHFQGYLSHMIYLHYTIELGFYSTLIFIFSMGYLLFQRSLLYKKTLHPAYLLQASMISGFMIAGFFDQLLYFNKYAFLVYVISTMPPMEGAPNPVGAPPRGCPSNIV